MSKISVLPQIQGIYQMVNKFNHLFFIIFPSVLNACHTGPQVSELYEVHQDGLIYVFNDHKLYEEFLSSGDTLYRHTRIGAGPNTETVVFGLTKSDLKVRSNIPFIKFYDGKLKQNGKFYAEMIKHNRIYIFDQYEDMRSVRQFGHPNYLYTEIGAGPKGETVVFVLNKSNKKDRPDTLIAKYKEMNT